MLELAKEADVELEFRYYCDYIAAGYGPLNPPELLFIDIERPGSRMSARRDDRNLTAYARWGLVTEHLSAHEGQGRPLRSADTTPRRKLAEGEFQLREYLDALEHGISRGQAQADLQGDPDFEVPGHGRVLVGRSFGKGPEACASPSASSSSLRCARGPQG